MIERASLRFDGAARASRTLVLAHGAGAPMDSPFMQEIATGVAARGLRVVRFEFPYMAQRRLDGSKKPPNTPRVLEQCWREVIETVGSPEQMVIGGKSMGGRIASQVADEAGVLGLVCLGYPFHPPRRPDRLRTAHLADLQTPTLIVQGERDPFGTRDEVGGYELSAAITTAWLADGEHSFRPRVRSGHTVEENLQRAVELVADFVLGL